MKGGGAVRAYHSAWLESTELIWWWWWEVNGEVAQEDRWHRALLFPSRAVLGKEFEKLGETTK